MTAPTSDGAQRYDRQIRLWGDHGQACLSRAAVLLINANPVGTEALKNLVLPGIASFTVVDGAQVREEDHGVNFFVPANGVKSRALAATEALHELNAAVEGCYIAQDLSSFIKTERDAFAFVKRYNVVIATQMSFLNPTLRCIAKACWKANVPLVMARAFGLVGYVRIQAREVCVWNAKEESVKPDLRLHSPFKELEQYVANWDLQSIEDSTQASHVPFVVILRKAVEKFEQKYGYLPGTRDEKEEFAGMVEQLRPKCCPYDAQNFEEALKRANLRLCYKEGADVSQEVKMVLSDEKSDAQTEVGFKCAVEEGEDVKLPELIRLKRGGKEYSCGAQRIAEGNACFWLYASGVRMFFEKYGWLPVRGVVPDMTADTESYVRLQQVYQTKSEADAKEVFRFATQIAEQHGMDVEVDEGEVRRFCKEVDGIRVYRTRSLEEELEKAGGFAMEIELEGGMDASERGVGCYYALLRAVDKFESDHGRLPGELGEEDERLVYDYVKKVREDLGVSGGGWRDECGEMVRYRGGELHNVCAFVGGVVAQEVTKIFAGVFEPVNSGVVFDLAQGRSFCFKA